VSIKHTRHILYGHLLKQHFKGQLFSLLQFAYFDVSMPKFICLRTRVIASCRKPNNCGIGVWHAKLGMVLRFPICSDFRVASHVRPPNGVDALISRCGGTISSGHVCARKCCLCSACGATKTDLDFRAEQVYEDCGWFVGSIGLSNAANSSVATRVR